jgi:hypothetical protein
MLDPHLPPSRYPHQGQRVVAGQRLLQATSDIFLGWNEGAAAHDYYWRQLHDDQTERDHAALATAVQKGRIGAKIESGTAD